MRTTDDQVESLGVERSRAAAGEADVACMVIDAVVGDVRDLRDVQPTQPCSTASCTAQYGVASSAVRVESVSGMLGRRLCRMARSRTPLLALLL